MGEGVNQARDRPAESEVIVVAGKRRKLGNPLALAVLTTLLQKPMHPYEIAQTLRSQGNVFFNYT